MVGQYPEGTRTLNLRIDGPMTRMTSYTLRRRGGAVEASVGDMDSRGIKGPRTDLSRPGSQAHVVDYRSPAR